jgi:hypothetical protein
MHPSTSIVALLQRCVRAQTLFELRLIAIEELNKFTSGAEVVCGPISTGGTGNLETNLKIFDAAIEGRLKQGKAVFSQRPYENALFRLRQEWRDRNAKGSGDYYWAILTEFYRPLFEAGIITHAVFIPGWESSTGAVWEREEFSRLQVRVTELSQEEIESFLQPA